MGKIDVALKIADEFGTSVGKASQFVDDVGGKTADELARLSDEGARVSSEGISRTTKALGGAGLVGGGALAWRQQEVERAKALAAKSQNYSDAVKNLAESDLPPEVKKKLAEGLAQQAKNNDGGNKDGGGGLPDLGDVFGDAQTTLILVIVAAIVLSQAVDGGPL